MTRDERGLTESVQWALLMPVLLGVLLGGLQVALTWHARNVALAAASAGAEAGAALSARPDDAHRAARTVLAGGGMSDVRIDVRDDGRTVHVHVAGRPQTVVPLGAGPVDGRAAVPKERVR